MASKLKKYQELEVDVDTNDVFTQPQTTQRGTKEVKEDDKREAKIMADTIGSFIF